MKYEPVTTASDCVVCPFVGRRGVGDLCLERCLRSDDGYHKGYEDSKAEYERSKSLHAVDN